MGSDSHWPNVTGGPGGISGPIEKLLHDPLVLMVLTVSGAFPVFTIWIVCGADGVTVAGVGGFAGVIVAEKGANPPGTSVSTGPAGGVATKPFVTVSGDEVRGLVVNTSKAVW